MNRLWTRGPSLPDAHRVAGRARALAAGLGLVLVTGLLQPAAPVHAEEVILDPAMERGITASYLFSDGPSQRRAAEAALLGSDTDVHAFVTRGQAEAQEADERAAAQVLAGVDGPAMHAAAVEVLDEGAPEEIRAFVEGGWQEAWNADERVRTYRVLEVGGPRTRDAAQTALAGTEDDISQFLSSGRHTAAAADDRQAARDMLLGGTNSSGPVLDAAAQRALNGTPEELREFLETGQFVARARDEELASIQGLTEQARQAGALAAQETLAATESAERAVNAAEQARAAAQTAEAETRAARGDAEKASAAAGRAADAAQGATTAAREALDAANATRRSAQVSADAARKATTAAALTAQAAARAQRAAADARTDENRAQAARVAAETALAAARSLRELEKIKAESERSRAEADKANAAYLRATLSAGVAADAADEAGQQSGVSNAQAQRARTAAAQARRTAGVAENAARRATSFAAAADAAADEAFVFAARAADHAERAAAAANDAADHAGQAAQAAQQSTAHAAAATQAADLAVAAATQAAVVEQLARQEDTIRIEEATEQGIMASQDAVAAEKQTAADAGEAVTWNRGLRWDTAEEDRLDPQARTWLAEATAPDAPREVVLDRARKVALRLVTIGGEWSCIAATEALASDEATLRAWLAQGRRFAAGQDDRARVWHLVDTLPDGPERAAAQQALEGDDAAVQQFLRTREYPGKVAKDRAAVYAMLETAGPALKAAAQKALAGTPAEVHQFLRDGQHPARTADARTEVYRVMEAGGPEVRASAQIALAGPGSSIAYFLQVGRFEAAQRDAEQAAHVAMVRGLLAQAQQYAQNAVQDAAEAQRVAAIARKAAAEAATWAQRASASAQQAATHATQARQSATQARTSADQAAASAVTARNAAAEARTSADQAARSAVTATAAAKRASSDAASAYRAKAAAAQSAANAGKDAEAANRAATDAATHYAEELKAWQDARRSTEPGSGEDGGTAQEEYQGWNCLAEMSTSEKCFSVYKDFGQALLDQERCKDPRNSGKAGCRMLGDIQEFVTKNSDLLMDVLQLVLGLCGLIPGVGEACDAVDAAISFKRGNWVDGVLSIGSCVPLIGAGFTGIKALKNSDKLRGILDMFKKLASRSDVGRACTRGECGIPGKSCFVAGTKVLTRDGPRDIEDVAVGEMVWTRDLVSGRDELQPVRGTYVRQVDRLLVVDVGSSTVTTTPGHPFSVRGRGWTLAGNLRTGDSLVTPDGVVPVRDVSLARRGATVHNFQVAENHNYYALAGNTPVLVHNADPADYSPNTPHGGIPNGGLGDLVSVAAKDPAADALAARLGGLPSQKFRDGPDNEFDTISDAYVAQTKPANFTLNKKFRDQAKVTFEVAVQSGRTPYFHFEGPPGPGVLEAIERYAARYGVKPVIDVEPLGGV